NVPAVLAGIRPRVAVVNNGPYKGGNRAALAALRGADYIEDVWQLHRSFNGGAENAPDAFMANLEGEDKDTAASSKVSAHEDGSFSISNARTRWTRNYDQR